ncbi:MAG TPA: PSD1 and planctomycete cytochrome C domain-containing protein, partial [Terriglobia bacterium]|nr:PSD1 and planctomycete cytochrome C domain-containing protein [Terriglobia bacterium]
KRQIAPILQRCQACHGAEQQMSGLRLDRRDDAMRGGYSGAVIQSGNSAASRLILLVAGKEEGKMMPPVGDKLTAREIGLLRAWIDQGAAWPEDKGGEVAAQPSAARVEKSSHWSFQPIGQVVPPPVRNQTWARSPVDQFVLARLESEGIEPAPEADKVKLLRRLNLDLIGLPPTPAEVADFLTDNRPDAYERRVGQLLDSPHYGEKWARQWLDLARYADSDGYEKDRVRPHAWRYRHWVIDALNHDMPFDQFTIEQIAGDLLPKASAEQKAATGFHRNTLTNREGGINIEQFRFEQVLDRTNTVGTVWMGLTVGCAQCHDHKYDPISQREYYQLFSFFNTAEEVNVEAPLAGEMGPYLQGLSEYRRKRHELISRNGVPPLQVAWEEQMLQAAANPGKWTDWDHAYDAFQKYLDAGDKILRTPPSQRTEKQTAALTDHFVENYHRVISKEREKELKFKELLKQLRELEASFPALSEAPAIAEGAAARKTHIHIRGDWRNAGVAVEPGTLAVLPPLPADARASRLTLAKWLVAPNHPLTARVAVNRIWQEYFGRGLVRTSEDFGTQGEKPSHPELLDWLAAGFQQTGWSLKNLHKQIVTSATYRQSSDFRPELQGRDPGNTLLARQMRLRLPAELIRDSALAASGLLYPVIGGKSIRPPQPAGLTDLGYASSLRWQESQGQDRYRRGLYILFQRTVPYPQLANFDAPDSNVTACRRTRSNTPLQALNLLNDPVFVEAAQALAARTLREAPPQFVPRVQHAFQLVLTRLPNPREQDWLAEYYQRQLQALEKEPAMATALAPPEPAGATPTEAAAWTAVSSVLLNLDEFITRE